MQRQSITQAEVESMLKAEPLPLHRLYMEALWYSGGRATETLQLLPEHVGDKYLVLDNLKQHTTYTDPATHVQKAIKGQRSRLKQVFVPAFFCTELQEWIEGNGVKRGKYIFSHDGGETHWLVESSWRIVTSAARRAGVMKVNRYGKIVPAWPHTFRHGNAEMLYAMSGNLLFVKQQLGHSKITTTEVYLDVTREQKEGYVEGVARLSGT